MWEGRVGLHKFKGNLTAVYNCQPVLAEDMSASQRSTLREKLAPILQETNTYQTRLKQVKQGIEQICPWIRPTSKADVVRCNDHTHCKVNKRKKDAGIEEWSCCTDNEGLAQCPKNYPLMCMNGSCDNLKGNCTEAGGLKSCPLGDKCAWLLPVVQKDIVQCNDGSYTKMSRMFGWPCKGVHGGKKRCSWDKPIMCAD